MLVDSHCHLNYLDDPAGRLASARSRGVAGFLCIGVDAAGIEAVLALAEAEPDVWASVGLHPEAAAGSTDWIRPLLGHPRVVAVGETGLDYFHAAEDDVRRTQREKFAEQLALAGEKDLPVVVHTRSAESDTLDLMRAHPGVVGVLHCFTESWSMAASALDLGYYVSISGIVTFRNGENVREVARQLPMDRLLIETDSPWLAPVPHRGRTNEPAFVVDTAACLSALRGCPLDELATRTTENFRRLFSRASFATI